MHYINVCEWGHAHDQCRCPDKNKSFNQVQCENSIHEGIVAGPYLDKVKHNP